MIFARQRCTSPYQHGLGLIEIMISLVIGLVVLGSLTYLVIGSRQTSKTHDDLSRTQESGRYALEIIGKAIRQSGYRLDVTQPLSGKSIEGTDGVSKGKGRSANAAPDTITLRHDPAWVKDASNALKGEEANCTGAIITSDNDLHPQTGIRPANTKLVVSSFSIDKGELRCTTVSPSGKSASAVVVGHIDNMQIEYGIDTIGNGSIASYVSAANVDDFSRVASVRVSLLVKGAAAGATTATANHPAQTLTFNGETLSFSDGFLRQVYTATFALRNPTR